MIRPGDYVVLQLGQNDVFPVNDTTRARGTIPGIGEETQEIDNLVTKKHEIVHTYGWYMRKYVNDAKARGAIPIMLSFNPANKWKDGKVIRAAATYAGWAQQIAAQTSIDFVDDNEITAEALEAMRHDPAQALFQDHILHTTPAGAQFNATQVVSGLKALKDNPLGKYLSTAGQAVPTFAPKQ
jgi:hypothetical protein